MAKSAFVDGPPQRSTVLWICYTIISTMVNITALFSSLIMVFHAYDIDSKHKVQITYSIAMYHGF